MSLNSNNQQLQTILDTVNALPDAGSGGSSAPETCTVNITLTKLQGQYGFYTAIENGERILKTIGLVCVNAPTTNSDTPLTYTPDYNLVASGATGNLTFENVECGSYFILAHTGVQAGMYEVKITNAEWLSRTSPMCSTVYAQSVFKITAPANGTATITVINTD